MAARRRTSRATPAPPRSSAAAEGAPLREGFVELGSTGLRRWSGLIDEEFLPQLKGTRGMRVYREMRENDPIVGAVLFAIGTLIRSVDWRVQPASDDPKAEAIAAHVESCLQDLDEPWGDTVSSILEFLPYGWSYHEVVYKYRRGTSPDPGQRSKYSDGAIGWQKLPIRAQDSLQRWEFDDAGNLTAMVQLPAPDFVERTIPYARALLFRPSAPKGSPEGRSVLRNAYRPWFFKKRLEEIESIGIERDLAGIPVLYAPSSYLSQDATPDQVAMRQKLIDLVGKLRRNEQEGVLLPGDRDENGERRIELSLLTTAGRRQIDVGEVVERYDRRIAMSCLADVILLGHEKVGSFALASSKTNLFATALWSFLDTIKAQFNRRAIPDLVRLNGWPEDLEPTLEHGDIESVDLRELGEYVSKLAGAGATLFPDTDLENALRRQAGLPERVEDEDGLDDDPGPTPRKPNDPAEDDEDDEDRE